LNPSSSTTGTADEAALREGAAVGSISPRAQIAVAGPDRAAYLQGLLTNDIQALAEGSGCYAAWLSPQGRMLTDMHVLQSAGMILLDVPADQASAGTGTARPVPLFRGCADRAAGRGDDRRVGARPQGRAVLERVIHGPRGSRRLERLPARHGDVRRQSVSWRG
jgi:hypothetical protein